MRPDVDEKGIHPPRHVDQWPRSYNRLLYLLPLLPGLWLLALLSRRVQRMAFGGNTRGQLADEPAAWQILSADREWLGPGHLHAKQAEA